MATRVSTGTRAFDLYLHPDVMQQVLNSAAVQAELASRAGQARERAVAIAASQGASSAQAAAFEAGVTAEVVDSDSLGINFDTEWGLGSRPVGVVKQSDDPVVRVVGGRSQAFKGALGSMEA